MDKSNKPNKSDKSEIEGENKTPEIPDIVKDIIYAVAIVAVILGIGYALTGAWPFMVAVESGSMVPHLHIGDVVFLVSPEKKHIVTWVEGKKINYKSFGDYGDVIIYYPNGDRHVTPVIHRVIAWVNKGQHIPVIDRTTGKLILTRWVAQSSGYITQGDNNTLPDEPTISQPVKPSWILGVAVYKIPYIGYPRIILQKII